jgi:hypothetical protein
LELSDRIYFVELVEMISRPSSLIHRRTWSFLILTTAIVTAHPSGLTCLLVLSSHEPSLLLFSLWFRIVQFLEERSDLKFLFSGYYLEENGATGGAQIPSKNFTGQGRSFIPPKPRQEIPEPKESQLTPTSNLRRLSSFGAPQAQHKSRTEGTRVIVKPELFTDSHWKVCSHHFSLRDLE